MFEKEIYLSFIEYIMVICSSDILILFFDVGIRHEEDRFATL